MSTENRLQRLEAFAGQHLAGDTAAQWKELQARFVADADNAALMAIAAVMAGSNSLRRLLANDAEDSSTAESVGELRRAVGQFCRRERLACPEASIVRVRAIPVQPDQSIVTTSGDPEGGRFLQFVECDQTNRARNATAGTARQKGA
jgi:hypothetical protein